MRGNSFASGQSSVHGNSMNNGTGGTDIRWQARLYGWVRDLTCWDFLEPSP